MFVIVSLVKLTGGIDTIIKLPILEGEGTTEIVGLQEIAGEKLYVLPARRGDSFAAVRNITTGERFLWVNWNIQLI